MVQEYGHDYLRNVEGKAEELVSLTLEVCEKRLAAARALSPEQTALSSAALSVRQSIKTFLAVTGIPGAIKGQEE